MANDLPDWVAELTDPRRAETLDQLADRLVPLAEHAIDVSRRLQVQLSELNDPFKRGALYERVERLKTRAGEALDEILAEIAASGDARIERIWDGWTAALPIIDRDGPRGHALRRRLDDEVVPVLARRQRGVADKVATRAQVALEEATSTLLTRVEELATAVTNLIHDVLPLAREGLSLASRVSALSLKARQQGRGAKIPDDLRAAADETAQFFDESVGRLELEWAALGARSAGVRAALRGAEESAYSDVTAVMTRCVEDLAAEHVDALRDAEKRARAVFDGA